MSNNLDEKNEILTNAREDQAELRNVVGETQNSLADERSNYD